MTRKQQLKRMEVKAKRRTLLKNSGQGKHAQRRNLLYKEAMIARGRGLV